MHGTDKARHAAQEDPVTCAIAEGNALVRRALTALLEAEDGVRVVGQAATAAQARRLVEQAAPEVLVAGVRLPDGTGIDLCRALQEHGTHVLLHAADGDLELLEVALEAGARGYLLQTALPHGLGEAVRALGTGRRHVDAALVPLLERRAERRRVHAEAREREIARLLEEGRTPAERAVAVARALQVASTG